MEGYAKAGMMRYKLVMIQQLCHMARNPAALLMRSLCPALTCSGPQQMPEIPE